MLLTSVLFGLGHYSHQGIAGVQQATIVGLLYGTSRQGIPQACKRKKPHG